MRDAAVLSDRRESRDPVHITLKTLVGPLMDGFREVEQFEVTKTIEIDGADWAWMSRDERLERIAEERHAWLEEMFELGHQIEGVHTLDDPVTEV